jgi:hypothetical protein
MSRVVRAGQQSVISAIILSGDESLDLSEISPIIDQREAMIGNMMLTVARNALETG